mgnify:CR=1
MLSLLFMNWLFFANQKKKHAIKFILVHLYIHKRADVYYQCICIPSFRCNINPHPNEL